MKTEVYSWRVSSELKSELEQEANRRKISLAKVLDLAARELLHKDDAQAESASEQARLQRAAAKCTSSIEGTDPWRSTNVRQRVRQRLRRRNDG